MALNYLSLKNYAESNTSIGTLSVSTLTGSVVTGFSTIASGALTGSTLQASSITGATALGFSTIAGNIVSTNSMVVPQIQLNSTMLSLGPNTQSTMVGASNGSYDAGSWAVAKTGLVNPKKLSVSSTGQYQLVVSEVTGSIWLSTDSGVTWSSLGLSQGLPVLTGSAQWVAGAVSASGQQMTLAAAGGSLWFSSDYGRTFAVSPQATPDVWVPFNGGLTDLMGSSTVTATGSPGYVNVAQPGFTGQAIQLKNTAGGTATQYVRGTIGSLDNFTVSFWMNMSSYSTTTNVQVLSFHNILSLYLNTAGQLNFFIPSSGGTGTAICGISSTFASNTWYYVSATFQTNGLCSFYINNTLIGSYSNVDGYGTFSKSGYYGIGTFSSGDPPIEAFDGLIADFRLYNRAVTYSPLPHLAPAYWLRMEGSVADAGSYSLVNTATPFISCAFDGVLTDAQGNSTVTAPGQPVSYVSSVPKGVLGLQSLNLVNTAGSSASQYIQGTWNGASNFTVSFWFNLQSLGIDQVLFSSYTANILSFRINTSNQLYAVIPSGGGSSYSVIGYSNALTTNTWYYTSLVFQTDGLCTLYFNNTAVSSSTNTSGVGTNTTTTFTIGSFASGSALAFNGYISNFRLHNTAFVQTPLSSVTPTIYLPFEGSVADERGFSTVMGTGISSADYTASVRTGALGIRAVNLNNSATVGGTASKYIQGTIGGSTNFTFSLWFNAQSLNAVQFLFSNYYDGFTVRINSGNTIMLAIPSNSVYSQTTITTTFTITTSTWYYVYVIIQIGGACSFYVNNILIGSANCAGLGEYSPSGTYTIGAGNASPFAAFNGYIDDFRIWNSAVPYVPVAVVNPVGSIKYVPGAVGQTALSLENTAGGTASQYVRSGWSNTSEFTITGWINPQSIVSNFQVIYSSHNAIIEMYIDANNCLVAQLPTGSGNNYQRMTTSYSLMANTWYHFAFIFRINGTCSFHVNGSQISSFTNSGGYGTVASSGVYSLGTYDNAINYAFNGYIDDFRLYNAAIPYSSLVPRNYSHLAMSGNGVYQMAATQVGNLWLSSNSGLSWAQQNAAATPGTWSSLSASYSGKYLTAQSQPVVQPNQSGLASATWSQQGVTYTATASSAYDGNYIPYNVFNNFIGQTWVSSSSYASGVYNGSTSTTIQGGIGTVLGEWLQLQVSVPMVLQSYRYSCPAPTQALKNYYIVGSNDGTTWFPIHYGVSLSSPFTAIYQNIANNIIVNYTGTQQVVTSTTNTSILTTSYLTSTSSYLYFRIISTSGWGASEIGFDEFIPNFIGGSITPNLSGLNAASWSQSGVGWTVTASSSLGASYEAFRAFNNANLPSWATPAGTYTVNSGAYAGSVSTFIQDGIGVVLGEWLQLQGSIPMVLQSYGYTIPTVAKIFKNYYIVGSNDGSTWYPLQYVIMTRNPSTVNNTSTSNNIIMNYSGIQTIQGNQTGEGTTTPYAPYVTQAWQYFRVIITSVWSDPTANLVEIGQFLPIFTAGQNSSSTFGASWTPTLQTGDAFNVTKNLTITSAGTGWAQLPAFTPVSQGVTISCWFTIQSTPALYSRLFDISSTTLSPSQSLHAFFNGDGTVSVVQYYNNVRAIQLVTNILSTSILYNIVWTVDQSGNNVVYVNGASQATGTQQLTIQTYPYFYIGRSNWAADPYPNMTVTDFRMFNRALNAAEVAQLYNNRNYGQPALGPLVTSESGEYVLAANQSVAAVANGYLTNHQISTYTNPLLAGISGPIVDTAVSQTGQNMILVTPSRQNNLYYSRDYGATFNGLTIGSSSLASGLVPLARLPLDGSAVDLQETLSPATGAGTVTYSTSIVKVGSASAFFNNIAGSVATNYLNYTVPPSLWAPSVLTMACWVYPVAYTGSEPRVWFMGFGPTSGALLGMESGGILQFYSSNYDVVRTTVTAPLNGWSHIAMTYNGNLITVYVNGISQITATFSGTLQTGATNLYIGNSNATANRAYNGYIDDVRIYTSALTAADVLTLYNNGTSVANDRSWPMVSCSISNDGSYLTATNSAGAVYRLNSNSQGYSLAIGSQAGQVNQAQNAIAIGNQAGVVNQSANSIILNASGSALNTNSSGFFVSPIGTTSGLNMELLGYGSDYQIVRSGVTVLAGAFVGIGTNNPEARFELAGDSTSKILMQLNEIKIRGDGYQHWSIFGGRAGHQYFSIANTSNLGSIGYAGTDVLSITTAGYVGIGTTNPSALLHINSTGSNRISGLYINTLQAGIVLDSRQSASGGFWNIWSTTNGDVPGAGHLAFYDNSAYRMILHSNGNVGIGTTLPTYKLHVVGDIYATANVIAMSDQRVKRDLLPLKNSLHGVSALQGYTYLRDGVDGRQMGLIAQEVKDVFPEAVTYDKENDRYGVNYGALIAPLINAIKEARSEYQTRIDQLQQRVEFLEKQLASS